MGLLLQKNKRVLRYFRRARHNRRLSGVHRNWRSAPIEISVNVVGRLDEGQHAVGGRPVDE
jgi:hypothetical protein